jgi:hypothetical protein
LKPGQCSSEGLVRTVVAVMKTRGTMNALCTVPRECVESNVEAQLARYRAAPTSYHN